MSEYDEFEIEYTSTATDANSVTLFAKVEAGKSSFISYPSNLLNRRKITVLSSGVTFENGLKFASYSATGTVDTAYLVPLKIYGIK